MSEPKKERNIKANEKWNIKSGFENDTVRPTLTYKDEKKEKPKQQQRQQRRAFDEIQYGSRNVLKENKHPSASLALLIRFYFAFWIYS